jgi:hypothetical protein
VTETEQDVRFGRVGYRASAALARAAGETLRGSIPGQPPQNLPPNDCQVRRLSALECLAASLYDALRAKDDGSAKKAAEIAESHLKMIK